MRKLISLILMLLLTVQLAYAEAARKTADLDAADETVTFAVNDCSTATFQITGTWSGTITFQATTTGNSWIAVPAKNANTGAEATTTTANGLFLVPCGGFNQVRASLTTATSGTASVAGQCGNGISFTNISLGSTTVSTGYEFTDDAAYTPGTSKVGVVGGEADDTTPDSVNEGDAGAFRISTRRELYTQIRDAAGNERGLNIDANGALAVGSVVPGTGATNLGKAIDTATGATDTGVLSLFTRDDALSALTPAETDNVQGRTDANGAIWTHDDALDAAIAGSELQVDVVGALPAGTNAIGKLAANSGVDIGDVDVTSVAGTVTVSDGAGALNTIIDSGTVTTVSTVTNLSQLNGESIDVGAGTEAAALRVTLPTDGTGQVVAKGANAHDAAALQANPVIQGFEAINTDGTPAPNAVSAEGDTVRGVADLYGRQLVSNQHPNSWCASEEETVAVTADEIKAAPGAGLSLYVCSFIVSNGATAGTYSLDEDSGGTPVILVPNIYTAINGGAVINLNPCYRVAANQEIGVTSATVTTGSYTVCGYTAP